MDRTAAHNVYRLKAHIIWEMGSVMERVYKITIYSDKVVLYARFSPELYERLQGFGFTSEGVRQGDCGCRYVVLSDTFDGVRFEFMLALGVDEKTSLPVLQPETK